MIVKREGQALLGSDLQPFYEELKNAVIERAPESSDIEARAARASSHLRQVAGMLRARGDAAPPLLARQHLDVIFWVDLPPAFWRACLINWLRLIVRRRSESSDRPSTQAIRRALWCLTPADRSDILDLDAAAPDKEALKWELRELMQGRRRLQQHASRYRTSDVDQVVAFMALWLDCRWAPIEAVLYWIARQPDLRFWLTPERAARIDTLAALIETTAGLAPRRPRWSKPPRGKWAETAYNLVMKFDASAEYMWARANTLKTEVRVNFLEVDIVPELLGERRNMNLVRLCGDFLTRASNRLGQRLRIARLVLRHAENGERCYEVTLETWERGDRIEGTLRLIGPLKLAWLDA